MLFDTFMIAGDTHFTKDFTSPERIEENLEAILKIADYNTDVNGIFFTGDITHHCLQEEFDYFARIIRKNLSRDIIVASVPGNHDVWRRTQKKKSATGKKAGQFLTKDELRNNLIVSPSARLTVDNGPFLHFSSGDIGWRVLGLDIADRTRAGGWANVAKADWSMNAHCNSMLSRTLNKVEDEINDVVVISHFKLGSDLLARIAFEGRPVGTPPRRVISVYGHCHTKAIQDRRVLLSEQNSSSHRSALVKDISLPSLINRKEYLYLNFDGKSIKTAFKEA